MATINKCLREIQSVRQVAQGAEAAYVARSRVGRLGLSVARLASHMVGSELPGRLGTLPVPREADERVADITKLAGTIQALSESIRQPSEPLDARWGAMWDELAQHLDSLEEVLLELDAEGIGGNPATVRTHDSLH